MQRRPGGGSADGQRRLAGQVLRLDAVELEIERHHPVALQPVDRAGEYKVGDLRAVECELIALRIDARRGCAPLLHRVEPGRHAARDGLAEQRREIGKLGEAELHLAARDRRAPGQGQRALRRGAFPRRAVNGDADRAVAGLRDVRGEAQRRAGEMAFGGDRAGRRGGKPVQPGADRDLLAGQRAHGGVDRGVGRDGQVGRRARDRSVRRRLAGHGGDESGEAGDGGLPGEMHRARGILGALHGRAHRLAVDADLVEMDHAVGPADGEFDVRVVADGVHGGGHAAGQAQRPVRRKARRAVGAGGERAAERRVAGEVELRGGGERREGGQAQRQRAG